MSNERGTIQRETISETYMNTARMSGVKNSIVCLDEGDVAGTAGNNRSFQSLIASVKLSVNGCMISVIVEIICQRLISGALLFRRLSLEDSSTIYFHL